MRILRAMPGLLSPALGLLLLVLVTPAAYAAGLDRSNVPALERVASPTAAQCSYGQAAAAEIRRWTRWNVRLTIPAWIPGVTGTFADSESDTGTGGPGREIFELDSSLTFALVGRLEARKGRWGVLVDAYGAKLTSDLRLARSGRAPVSGRVSAILGHAELNFCLGERWVGVGRKPTRLRAWVYAGVRYNNVHLVIDRVLLLRPGRDTRREWFDPLVGLRFTWDLSRQLTVGVEGDVGGFGVESDIAYWASAEVKWRFTTWFSVGLGYTALHFERTATIRGERTAWDATLHGPMLTLSFKL